MSLFALITALLLEQLRPLASHKYPGSWLYSYVRFFQHHFNAGQHRHGRIAWLVAVLPLLAAVMLSYWLLYRMHPILAWAFNVLVLYLTMGFRQFSHYFTDIQQALRTDRLDDARRLLTRWRGMHSHEFNAEEVARVTIEQGLVASQHHVFGVIVWFVLFSALGWGGAAGALLYRLGQFLRTHWDGEDGNTAGDIPLHSQAEHEEDEQVETAEFGGFARKAFCLLEWLPARLIAFTFAIVGDFEDTIYCWRTQAHHWPDTEEGILLASGAGALGVRLGMPLPQGGFPVDRAELGMGDAADPAMMQRTIGLVWRSVVLWMIVLLALFLASQLA
jgi:adenosylcobinamide-phosphate synthase